MARKCLAKGIQEAFRTCENAWKAYMDLTDSEKVSVRLAGHSFDWTVGVEVFGTCQTHTCRLCVRYMGGFLSVLGALNNETWSEHEFRVS